MKKNQIITPIALVFMTLSLIFTACSNREDSRPAQHAGDTASLAGMPHEAENMIRLSREEMQAAGIRLGRIEEKLLSEGMRVNGMLRVPNDSKAKATSLFGGIVSRLNVELGDQVSKGQVIALISNPDFIQVQEAYLQIQQDIELARTELQRQQTLFEGQVGAQKNLQKARSLLHGLQTRRAALRQEIQLMGLSPESLSNARLTPTLQVRSPLSGTVSEVYASIGSYVDVSSPIAGIVENQSLHLDLYVFEKDLDFVQLGQQIEFVVSNNPGQTYAAEVYKIGASFDDESKSIAVHCHVTGGKTGLIDGMNVSAKIQQKGVTGQAVPSEAIVSSEGKNYIFLLIPADTAENQSGAVEPGSARFRRVEVLTGVQDMGYTAITPVNPVKTGARLAVTKGFFIQAKLSGMAEAHHH